MPLAEHATQVLVTRPGWQVCTRYISGWNLISSQVNLSKNVTVSFLVCSVWATRLQLRTPWLVPTLPFD